MKILAIGDPHFKLDFPYADLIKDRRLGERSDILETIHATGRECDVIVFMGDNLDKRHNHSSVITDFVNFIKGFGQDKPIFIISGNHEVYDGDKTALDFLKGLPGNVTVITPKNGVTSEVVHGELLGFVPYMTNASLGVTSHDDGVSKILEALEHPETYSAVFLHHAISGESTDLFDEIVIPREALEEISEQVVAGHIHKASQEGNTTITGNIMTHEMGEESKAVWVVDTTSSTTKPVPLPVRPIKKMINPSVEELDSLDKRAIIKAILTEKGQDVDSLRAKLNEFDAFILLEDYPMERRRIHSDSAKMIDLSVESLIELYAKEKGKDPERLKKALEIIKT